MYKEIKIGKRSRKSRAASSSDRSSYIPLHIWTCSASFQLKHADGTYILRNKLKYLTRLYRRLNIPDSRAILTNSEGTSRSNVEAALEPTNIVILAQETSEEIVWHSIMLTISVDLVIFISVPLKRGAPCPI